jgi:hypothetical protein
MMIELCQLIEWYICLLLRTTFKSACLGSYRKLYVSSLSDCSCWWLFLWCTAQQHKSTTFLATAGLNAHVAAAAAAADACR